MNKQWEKLNPGILKLELFCKGMRIDPTCDLGNDARLVSRIRAGLGSGLEMILPDNLYANIPVLEEFAKQSPFLLIKRSGRYYIIKEGSDLCQVTIPSQPLWYQKRTSNGTLMSRVGMLQGTYLAIYPARVCNYWLSEPRQNCKFCATGLNVGVTEEAEKSVEDVVETTVAARKESRITFVHFNTGYCEGKALDILAPYVKAVKEETGLLIGVQCPPQKELSKYDMMMEMGADHFSFCFEFFNKEVFQEVCPGKAKTLGQETFFRAMEYTTAKMGKGKVSGEIIAGLEPIEDTLKAIDYITSIGAFPTICIFRPLIGTDYQTKPSPKFEDMLLIFRHMYEACKKNSIPTDIAPKIRVSLVVLPYEGRYFMEGYGFDDFIYSCKLTLMRLLFRTYYGIKLFLR